MTKTLSATKKTAKKKVVDATQDELKAAHEWMEANKDAVQELGKEALISNIDKYNIAECDIPQTPEYTATPYGNKFLDLLPFAESIVRDLDSTHSMQLKMSATKLREALRRSKDCDYEQWYVRARLLFRLFAANSISLEQLVIKQDGAMYDKEAPITGPTSEESKKNNHSPAEEQAEWEREKFVPDDKWFNLVHPDFIALCKSLLEQLGHSGELKNSFLYPRITFMLMIENMEMMKTGNIGNEIGTVGYDEDGGEHTSSGFKRVDIKEAKAFWAYWKTELREQQYWPLKIMGQELSVKQCMEGASMKYQNDRLFQSVAFAEYGTSNVSELTQQQQLYIMDCVGKLIKTKSSVSDFI